MYRCMGVRTKNEVVDVRKLTVPVSHQVESGGTVLSTNWKDIKEKKVEVKPPDGMEYKKWQQ